MTHTETRSIQVIATVTGAFALPLMVNLSIGGQTSALREFVLQCVATTTGAAIGFAFFLPKGSFSGSLFRRVSGGAAVGLVVGFLIMSRLQMGPVEPLTLFGLSFFSALGAFGAWGLSLKDDLIERRRRGEPVVWPVKVFFGNGVWSICAWVALGFAACISYYVFDIAQVACGQKPAAAQPLAPTRDFVATLPTGIVARSKLPVLPNVEKFGTYLTDRRDDLLANIKVDAIAATAHHDAATSVNDSFKNTRVVVDELEAVEEPATPTESADGADRYADAAVPELLAVIANTTSRNRAAAVTALDRVDPGDASVHAHRGQIAKTYKALAEDCLFPELQPSGVWGMVRWGGAFSVPYLVQLLEDDPSVALADAIFAALAELNDARGAAAVARMAERAEYHEAAVASLQAMGEVAEQVLAEATSHFSD